MNLTRNAPASGSLRSDLSIMPFNRVLSARSMRSLRASSVSPSLSVSEKAVTNSLWTASALFIWGSPAATPGASEEASSCAGVIVGTWTDSSLFGHPARIRNKPKEAMQ